MKSLTIVLLSGPIAVGKTAIRDALVQVNQFEYIKSSAYLKHVAGKRGLKVDRRSLQELGDKLDSDTDYRWVIDFVARPAFEDHPSKTLWLVDAVRKERQVKHFREAFGGYSRVFHVHLHASEEILKRRYEQRQQEFELLDKLTYEAACDHDNERSARALINIADYVCSTSSTSTVELSREILSELSKRYPD